MLATGACNLPVGPGARTKRCRHRCTASLPSTTADPEQLPDGGVLVVGASATGVQLAWEIHRSGRPVTLAVGEHVRLPRTYRGRDVLWWMDAAGIWNQRYDEIDDLTRARRLPSPQLVGTPERTTLDLNVLSGAGVALVGRLAAIRDGRALFSGGLRNQFALADLKMERLLDAFDEWARARADAGDVGPPERFAPTAVPPSSRLDLDLESGEIRTIVWATGFHPDYRWLDVPVLDRKGHLRHEGGASSTRRACTPSACRCCAGANRPSSTAPKTMPGTSSRIWCPIWHTLGNRPGGQTGVRHGSDTGQTRARGGQTGSGGVRPRPDQTAGFEASVSYAIQRREIRVFACVHSGTTTNSTDSVGKWRDSWIVRGHAPSHEKSGAAPDPSRHGPWQRAHANLRRRHRLSLLPRLMGDDCSRSSKSNAGTTA